MPEKWIKDSLQVNDEVKTLFAAGDYTGLIPGGHYRNQIWAQSELGLLICLGINGQTIFVNQSTGGVVVKFSTHPTAGDLALFSDTLAAMQAITEYV